jgi:Domain of unknown function (DUF222)
MFEWITADRTDMADPDTEDVQTPGLLLVTREDCSLDIDATLRGLAEAQPGPEVQTAAVLIAGLHLSDSQRVDVIAVLERCDSWLQAVKQPVLAGLSRAAGSKTKTPGRHEDIGLELSLKLCWSEWMAHDRMGTARLLDDRLPRTWAALAGGEISFLQARVIAAGAALLDHPEALDPVRAAAELEERIFPKVTWQSRAETEKAVLKAVIGIDPQAAEKRRTQTRQDRGVFRTSRPRGLEDRLPGRAGLFAQGPVEDMATIWQALSLGADDLVATGEVDNLSQGRHDTMLGWAIEEMVRRHAGTAAPAPNARPTSLTVISKDTTQAGLDDDPAELVGWGPITAETARDLARGVPPRPGPFSAPRSPVDADTVTDFGHTQFDEIDDPDTIDTITDRDLAEDLDDGPPDDSPDDSPDEPPDEPPDGGGGPRGEPVGAPRAGGGADPPSPAPPVDVRVLRIDPENGFAQPPPGLRLDYGSNRRTFPPRVVQYLKDKYRVCAFPGCTALVHQLDGDHWQSFADGGLTDATDNGGPCCAHHNRVTRNQPGWTISPDGGGTATLTTPHGRNYPVEPFDYRDL